MKTIRRWLGLAAVIWLAFTLKPSAVFAQDAPTPGPEHLQFKRLEGEWIATVKSFGTESKGTMTYRLECGGLWLVSDFRGEFGGQKFQGRGLDTYDAQKKKYVSVWVDSMSTTPLLMEGEMDKDKKTVTMVGEGPGPDGKPAKYKSVTRHIDPDHEAFKMYMVGPDGKDAEAMTIEYTRKK